jgi:alpha-tubulin suppressor-like RCC1 family protein
MDSNITTFRLLNSSGNYGNTYTYATNAGKNPDEVDFMAVNTVQETAAAYNQLGEVETTGSGSAAIMVKTALTIRNRLLKVVVLDEYEVYSNWENVLNNSGTTPIHKPMETMVQAKTSTGGSHTLALRADNTVWAYGLNEHGELGISKDPSRSGPYMNDDPNGIIPGVKGADDPVEIKTYQWTQDSNGIKILGATASKPKFIDIAAGEDHSLLVDSDGNVWAAGSNEYGQLGFDPQATIMATTDGMNVPLITPVVVPQDEVDVFLKVPGLTGVKIVEVSAGDGYSMALAEDGTVYVWGRNDKAQLGLDSTASYIYQPTELPLLHAAQISAGKDHALVRNYSGNAYAYGNNVIDLDAGGTAYGKLGLDIGEKATVSKPTYVSNLGAVGEIVAVSAGDSHNLALTYMNSVLAWGNSESGRLGVEPDGVKGPIELLESPKIVEISAGRDHSMALESTGQLWSWGGNRNGQLGLGMEDEMFLSTPTYNITYLVDAEVSIKSISAGNTYGSVSDMIGQVYGMGDYTHGEKALFQNDTMGDSPVLVGEKGQPSSKHIVVLRVGESADVPYILSERFNLYTDFQENGIPTVESKNSGIAEVDSVNVVDSTYHVTGMSYGFTHVVVHSPSGKQHIVFYVTVLPENENHPLPKVAHMVAAGGSHTVALKDDGTVWAWGDNSYGQLGVSRSSTEQIGMNQNSYYYSDVPVKEFPDMMDGEYIIQVSVGEDHSAALSSENRLFTWGRNEWGQLGQGELAGEWVDVPTEVILSTEKVAKPAKVVAGNQHTAVLTEDGQVYTFGHNHYGQLGLGVQDVNRHMTPERVKGMSKVIDLSEGSRSDTVHAVRYDGTLWAWGDNQYGQIHSTSGQQYYYKPILAKINTDCNYYKCPSCGDIHREIDLTFQGNSAMGTIEAVCPSCGGSIDQDADLDHTDNVLAGKQILKVYDGMNHSLALLNDGHIISWGGNMYGQLGNGSVSQQQEGAWPVVVGNPDDDGMGEYVVAVRAQHRSDRRPDYVCLGREPAGPPGSAEGRREHRRGRLCARAEAADLSRHQGNRRS